MISKMYNKQTVSSLGGVYKLHTKTSSFLERGSVANPAPSALVADKEVAALLPRLNQRAAKTIQRLHGIYGELLYKKMIPLAKANSADGLKRLESELLSGQLEQLLKLEAAAGDENQLPTAKLSEEYGETVNHLSDDLDYLDALASHDFRRLNKFSSSRESLGAIFSEIVENEHQNNSNFQDDVFEKNIQLIFNSEVDLDDNQWPDASPQAGEAPSAALAINKSMSQESSLLRQLNFFSFYEGAKSKSHPRGAVKPNVYYLTFWMGIFVAALAFAWLFMD